jgi:hypothetical protein
VLSTDREARGAAIRGPQPDPLTTPTTWAATIVTETVVARRGRLVDLRQLLAQRTSGWTP